MKFPAVLAFGVALLPATAFAQMFEGPNGSIPAQQCVQTTAAETCTHVLEGAGLTAATGYARVDGWDAAVSSRQAATVAPGGPAPFFTR